MKSMRKYSVMYVDPRSGEDVHREVMAETDSGARDRALLAVYRSLHFFTEDRPLRLVYYDWSKRVSVRRGWVYADGEWYELENP